jgi:hypothetical protein
MAPLSLNENDYSAVQVVHNVNYENAPTPYQEPKRVQFALETGNPSSSIILPVEETQSPAIQVAHTPSSMILQVEDLYNRAVDGGLCKYLVKTTPLKSHVKCIVISTKWLHSLQAATKVVLTLYDSHGQVKKRLDLFGTTSLTGSRPHRFISAKEQIVSKQAPGDHYQLECKVTLGENDKVTIKGLVCKIISSKTIGTPYQLTDLAFRKGTFVGRVDDEGYMHGKGSFHYLENGHTFVGHFEHGKWIKGVLYYGDKVKLTMNESRFDKTVDMSMTKRFQHNFQYFSKFSSKKTSVGERSESEIEEIPSSAFCGCFE